MKNKFQIYFFFKCVIVRSAKECRLGAAWHEPLHNWHSKMPLQIIENNVMTALLNFIRGYASEQDLTTGHLE